MPASMTVAAPSASVEVMACLDYGSAPVITAMFVDVDGVATDPTAVLFTVVSPSGTVETFNDGDPEVSNPSVGTWALTYPTGIVEFGKWLVSAEGTAGLIAVAESSFVISASILP